MARVINSLGLILAIILFGKYIRHRGQSTSDERNEKRNAHCNKKTVLINYRVAAVAAAAALLTFIS